MMQLWKSPIKGLSCSHVLLKSGSQRGLGLQGSSLKNAGLQDRKFRALGLHLGKNSIFVRAPSRDRLWTPGSTTKISGLQRPPFGTL